MRENAAEIPIPSERPVMLACEGIWKVFGPGPAEFVRQAGTGLSDAELAQRGWVAAVRDACLRIHAGEVFVIMGLSGSGKSTLVRCLTRLVEPTAGRVLVEDRDFTAAGDKTVIALRRAKMGMVFQHFALLPHRSVLANISFPLEVQGMDRRRREARARELISLVGLEGREQRFPAELSGGQQQRVGIARSLATDPAIWFLDEPFSALDPLIRNDMQDELLRLQATLAKTVVFITHDLDEAIRIADRIAIMEHGRIIQIGSPEQLVTRPATDYVRRFVAKVPKAKVVRVASLLDPDGQPGDAVVSATATVEDIAPRLLDAGTAPAVVDASGRIIGALDRARALRILAGVDD